LAAEFIYRKATMRTLVLNAAYEPIHLVTWEKAMCLVVTSKAEIVAEYDEVVRSVSRIYKLPSVVRLKSYVRTFRRTMNSRCTRRNILLRDQLTCQYCSQRMNQNNITIDHVKPRCHGGGTEWNNVVAACHPCNRKKADLTPEQAGLRLIRTPKSPTWIDLLEESHRELINSWLPFITNKTG
jgi:5-methylcytosine-specific restriction endonuclease McrA